MSTAKQLQKKWQKRGDELQKYLQKTAPKIIAVEMEKNITDNFRKSKDPPGRRWRARKERGRGHPLLVDKTDLRDSIKVEPKGNKIVVSSDQPYVEIHNQRGRTGRRRSAYIPKRQYAGVHKNWANKAINNIKQDINKIINS